MSLLWLVGACDCIVMITMLMLLSVVKTGLLSSVLRYSVTMMLMIICQTNNCQYSLRQLPSKLFLIICVLITTFHLLVYRKVKTKLRFFKVSFAYLSESMLVANKAKLCSRILLMCSNCKTAFVTLNICDNLSWAEPEEF